MKIHNNKKEILGHCNFCYGDEHDNYKKVYDLVGYGSSIRLCLKHLKNIKFAKKEKKEILGHCNFCTGEEHKNYRKVYEAEGACSSFRICQNHLNQIAKEL